MSLGKDVEFLIRCEINTWRGNKLKKEEIRLIDKGNQENYCEVKRTGEMLGSLVASYVVLSQGYLKHLDHSFSSHFHNDFISFIKYFQIFFTIVVSSFLEISCLSNR